MKILPPARVCQCAKPRCTGRYTHRHHLACETMWIRAFLHKKRTKRYKAFVRRYRSFNPLDWVEICEQHHEEIHDLYGTLIMRAVRQNGHLPIKRWSWKQADTLMAELRTFCRKWLKIQTPGMKLRKFAR